MIRTQSTFTKYFTVIGIFVLAIAANSSLADESENTLDALHFRPAQSNVVGRVDFTPNVFYRSYSPASNPNSFGTEEHFPLSAGVSYGVTDLLSIGIGETFLFHSTNQTERPNGHQTSGSAGGFSDPTLSANYRYVGGLSGNFFADAYVNLSPSIGDDETTSFPGGGNNLRGASTYQVGSTAYVVSGQQEASLDVNGTFETSANLTSGSNGTESEHDSFFGFAIRGEYRYHLNEKLYADATATFNFLHTVDETFPNENPLRTDTVHYPCYVVPRVGMGYLISSKWLATLGVSYQELTSSDTETRTSVNTNDTETKSVVLDAGVRFIL